MSEQQPPDYKATLTVTTTEFPQKASLSASEPARLEHWKQIELEKLLLEKGRGANPATGKPREKYVLHDGPPYANGDIHLGHALNKTLKDIVVRYKTMRGYHSYFVPGYDCHGLPIEQKVIEKIGQGEKSASPLEIRKLCAEYAQKYIGLQTSQFQRLGVGGAWDTPYLTLAPGYEVGILKALRAMVQNGSVYRGFKPVYWDTRFRTALAEAEIEYEEHTSPSIYVRFPVLNSQQCAPIAEYSESVGDIRIVIWTTTPWTLPGNLAVSVHPGYDYVLFKTSGEKMICAEYLLEGFKKEAGLADVHILTRFKGAELEGLECSHPLLDKASRVILGEHVTLEQGTGCVHTAPGHGVEDFEVCARYKIPTVVPVDEKGCFNEEFPEMQGEFVWKANPKIIKRLEEKGLLVWSGKIQHQYAYSWRSHEPTIVRATHQWFMRLDHDGIRQKCLDAIDNSVRWIPSWGRDRIYNMMANRPDWCLSRQRSWGVPIPAIYSVQAKQSILCPEVIDKFIEQVAEHGTDCWFSLDVKAFIPEGFKCPISGGTEFEKEFDILDVWFDSGSSHIAVLESDPENLVSPADLYLEGSDQHRGWFNSSLVNSMASRDRAPYKAVLTHGFVLDGNGYAMSKSKGNVISPLAIIKDMGADVLRLWVISEDYRNDIRASDSIFKQMMEAYRRVRNTLRFLLGNLGDFDPAKHLVPAEKRLEVDRWALAKLAELIEQVTEAYESFEFHRIHHLVQQFVVVTLSAVYLDLLKDRLYCSAPGDLERRSPQSTLWDIFSALARMLAPIMPFTSDEAWMFGHPARPSVHLEDFPTVPDAWHDAGLVQKWSLFLQLREMVMRPMEELRRAKEIGKNLDAAVILTPKNRELCTVLQENQAVLKELFIVSSLKIVESPVAETAASQPLEQQVEVQVVKALGEKCPRCWTYSETPAQDPRHPSLCARCADVVRRLNPS